MDTLLDQAAARLNRLPFFSPADYAALNADVAQTGTDLTRHALRHGCAEKRHLFKRGRLARSWGEALARVPAVPASGEQVDEPLPPSASVFVSSWSDPATRDLAQCLVRDLILQGVAATLATERSVPEADLGAAIVVAPQDFFRLGFGPAWRNTALPGSALTLNTAPLMSEDFVGALPYLLAGRGVLDLSPQIVDLFSRADVPARQIRPTMPLRERWLRAGDADHPLVQTLPAEARRPEIAVTDPRPIDVSVIDKATPARGECLARIAPELQAYRTFFHLRSADGDDLIERQVLDRAQFRLAGHLAARSKIALRIAENEVPFFDWHVALQAMSAGAVIVTDCFTPHGEFEAGLHLFQDDSRHLPDLIRWLLDDPQGRAAANAARSATQAILSDPSGAKAWTAGAAALWNTT